ncbi:MAG: hypothetical protein NT062_23410 [Proteobacteria bacterium]|nr:hypothetical protein [Pseudomonadota bacterium]
MRVSAITFLSAACVMTADQAWAGPADDAEALAGNGDFLGAAAKYREAYAADPRPELMCNVGVAYYKAKDYPHASRFLEQCVVSGSSLDAGFMTAVKQVVTAVDEQLRADAFAPIEIAVEPATATTIVETNGHTEEPLVGSRRTWIAWGHYKLTIHAEGYVDRVLEGDAQSHEAIPARVKLAPKPVTSTPKPINMPTTPPAPGRSRSGAIVTSGIAVAGGVAALGSFLLARSSAADAGDATKLVAYNKAKRSAESWQHASWVAGGIGGVAAIAASVLWYRATRSPVGEAIELDARPTPGGATVSLGFAF